jgi:acyl dehydratase
VTVPRTLTTLNNYFDELEVGDRFTSDGRTLSEEDIATFAALSGDRHPLHTDPVWARDVGPFGARVAQGCLTLSLATGLEFELIGSDGTAILAFYGMDRVRFVKPVFVGDTIHIEGEVTSLEPKDASRGVVTMHQEIVNQDGDVVAVLDKRSLHTVKDAQKAAASEASPSRR